MKYQHIRKYREQLGLTQQEAIELTQGKGSASQWRKYERGERPMPARALEIFELLIRKVPKWTFAQIDDQPRGYLYHNEYPRMVYDYFYYSLDHTLSFKNITSYPSYWTGVKSRELGEIALLNLLGHLKLQTKRPTLV